MGKVLEVREFDSITCNPDFRGEYACLPEKVFYDLAEFIRSFTSDPDHADALDFLKISYRRNVGDVISVNNYVGLIQMQNGYQIEVLPKIDFGSAPDTGNTETKRVFLRMLRSMKDFPGKVSDSADLKVSRMNLYEIFISMYLDEVRILVKHGIRSAYIRQEGNLSYYKGKLCTGEQIKQNAAHAERFYMQYDEYQVNRAENRIVKTTLQKLQRESANARNQKEIRQLLAYFEMVELSVNPEKDFAQVSVDRSTRDYEILMRWSKVFLFNLSFSAFSGGTKAKALLFPMEKVFETYVADRLKKCLADLPWEISVQDKGHYLFDSPRRFSLRPDIVITRDDGSTVILDTKWKSLCDIPEKNYGIAQADMYQMYAYAKKYETSEVWLLYPVNQEMRGHEQISFESCDGVKVQLFFVDVANIEESFRIFRKTLCKLNI